MKTIELFYENLVRFGYYLGIITLRVRVLRASPYLHLSSPASSSVRDSIPLSVLPPFLSLSITSREESNGGYIGSHTEFGSIYFIIAGQVTSSTIDRDISSHPIS